MKAPAKVRILQPMTATVLDDEGEEVGDYELEVGEIYEVANVEGPDRSVGIFGSYVELLVDGGNTVLLLEGDLEDFFGYGDVTDEGTPIFYKGKMQAMA